MCVRVQLRFIDYLFACHQVVKFNNETSEKLPLTSGVPQASILGPILFLMFFNDFEDSLNFSKSIQFAEEMLDHDLSSISKYLKCIELIINLQ